MPGDLLAIKLYRLLEDKPEGDLLHVLNAIKARQRSAAPESIAAPMSERERFVRASLQAALQALGRTPSRRAYEKWRAQQPQPSEFASEGLIKKVLGGWTAATESLGAPVADHSARRLMSKGRAFSVIECREAIRLYTESTPPDQLGVRHYARWARAYARTPGARRVPLIAHTLKLRLRTRNTTELWAAAEPLTASHHATAGEGEAL